jgi:hypothetical protein
MQSGTVGKHRSDDAVLMGAHMLLKRQRARETICETKPTRYSSRARGTMTPGGGTAKYRPWNTTTWTNLELTLQIAAVYTYEKSLQKTRAADGQAAMRTYMTMFDMYP